MKIIFIFLENTSCVVIAGGTKDCTTVEVLVGDQGTMHHQNLPKSICLPSMIPQNGSISLLGGTRNLWKCLQLVSGTWKEHSVLNEQRFGHSAVTTQSATFVFGGLVSPKTYEYLPKDSNTWIKGKPEIPGDGFAFGSAIAVKSEQEIWLIGGGLYYQNLTVDQIICFNVKDHSFQTLPYYLNIERRGHRCAFIPNTNKIMITGGRPARCLASAEILDVDNGSVTSVSPMNSIRHEHGMGVLTINGEDRLVVFGGYDGKVNDSLEFAGKPLDTVEVYNTKTKKWETLDIKLKEPKHSFGFMTIKLSDIISQLS